MEDNPELGVLKQFEYSTSRIFDIDVYFSQDKIDTLISLKDVEDILKLVPKEHKSFIPRIYIVSYLCQDNPKTLGRHLAGLNYIIIYPAAYQELKEVLLHEIGHVLWDKKLIPQERIQFYQAMLNEVPLTSTIDNEVKMHIFILENFANCYQFFLCNIFDSEKYPTLYQFISSLF